MNDRPHDSALLLNVLQRNPGRGSLAPLDLALLTAHPAYLDSRDPSHLAVKTRVGEHFAAQPGAQDGGSPVWPVIFDAVGKTR